MLSNYQRLANVASKKTKHVLGLMSGTSMDGLDVALCRISGQGVNTSLELMEFDTIPHNTEYKEKIRTVFTHGNAEAVKLTWLHQFIAEVHAEQIRTALDQWNRVPEEIDLIASHGQTVYHNPSARPFDNARARPITLQLGDGDFIAERTGIVTVSDFRKKHIAHGGEGAPLAPYGDFLLFSDSGERRMLVNIGGIANFTFLPQVYGDNPLMSSDTGPGNTLMDAYMQKHFDQPFDRNGEISRMGNPDPVLLKVLMDDPFFDQPLPRSTGPELFNLTYIYTKQTAANRSKLAHEDVMATLAAFTAKTIYCTIGPYLKGHTSIYFSGGGVHNPLVMKSLQSDLRDHSVYTTEALGINPDAKEAIVFAVLANECLFGRPKSYPELGIKIPRTSMGKVSFPG